MKVKINLHLNNEYRFFIFIESLFLVTDNIGLMFKFTKYALSHSVYDGDVVIMMICGPAVFLW